MTECRRTGCRSPGPGITTRNATSCCCAITAAGLFGDNPTPRPSSTRAGTGPVYQDHAQPQDRHQHQRGASRSTLVGGATTIPTPITPRARIVADHESYQKGLLWFLANDPRVPEKYRRPLSTWGLAKDEFADNGHWPRQLYVREARRMVGAYVLTQHDCEGKRSADDPVGLGSYTMDSHTTQRYVDSGGFVRNEGDSRSARLLKPYPISYRTLVPRADQCTNLLVPVCSRPRTSPTARFAWSRSS